MASPISTSVPGSRSVGTANCQALAAAKARGVTLGNPKLSVARKSALEAVTTKADRFAANVLPIIREAQKAGAATLRESLRHMEFIAPLRVASSSSRS
jgi:hypothetical protein